MHKVVKRFLVLLLSLVCLWVPGLSVEATETYGEQLVENGGFEILDAEGHAKGWEAYKGWNGGFAELTTERVHSGKYAMKISTESGGNPWVMYKAPASPNTSYQITAKMFTENLVGRVAVKVEWSSPNDEWLRGADAENLDGGIGSWGDYVGTTESIGDVGFIMIYMRLYGTGTVYVDDVELYATSEPPVGGITTDEVFFYPEWTEGNANIKANGTAYKNVTNGKTDLFLKDGETVLESKTGVQLENGETNWKFSTVKMTEEGKPYTLEAVIYNESGEKVGSCIREIFRYRRPEALDANGDYYVNGELFIPHIMYHVSDYGISKQQNKTENMESSIMQYGLLKEAGYNVVQMSTGVIYYPETVLASLDKLHEFGLKGMLPLYDKRVPASRPERADKVKAVIEAVKDHPALFAYGVYDEPALGNYGLTEQDLIDTYRLVRDIDKVHPTFTVIAPGKFDAANPEKRASMVRQPLTKYVDVLCYDPYVACWDDVMSTYVYEIHKAAEEFVLHDRPCYNLNQVFDWRNYFPTVDEYRHMWYQAAIGGTKGPGMYSFNDSLLPLEEGGKNRGIWESDIWPGIQAFKTSGEMDMSDQYFHTGKYPIFDEKMTKDYLYRSYVDGNDLYAVVLRIDETRATSREEQPPVPVSIPLVSANGKVKIGEYSAKLLYGATTKTQTGNGTLEMSLGWRKALVFKITPNTQIDFSSLSVPAENKPSVPSNTVNLYGIDDMDGYEWAAEAVKEMIDSNAMSATGLFRPGDAITRGEFAGLLIRTLGFSGEQGENFADVSADYAYAKEIAIGRAAGVLNGLGDNLYAPDTAITRQDIMTIILRSLEAMDKTAEKGEITFRDASEVSGYALPAVSAMAKAGVVVGNEAGYFMPLANTTRAEAAVIFHRVKNVNWPDAVKEEVPEIPEEKPEKVTVTFSEGEVSKEETVKRTEAINLLTALDIIEAKDLTTDDAVTRGQAAKIFVRLMGDKSEKGTVQTVFSDAGNLDEYSGYVEAAVNMGLMSGLQKGTFGTDQPLTYGAAVKVLVDILGYKAHAESRGGYLSGYLACANQLDLTKGVTILDGPIRGGAFARLIENALDIAVANPAGYGGDTEYSFTVDENVTLLLQNHNILKHEGKITATYMAHTEPASGLKPGEVVINGIKMDGTNVDADAFLARKVSVYVPKNDDLPEILYIRAKENSTVETVNASDVLSGTDGLFVFDTESGERKVSLSNAQLIYNGLPTVWTNTWMPESGKITLIYDGSVIETVLVDAYKNYVVDRIDKENSTLFFKENTDYPEGLTIDTPDKAKKITLSDSEGNEINIDLCDEWNVISVAASADGNIIRAIRSVENITGKVMETSGESVLIDGTEYGIAFNIRNAVEAKKPVLGQTAVFYLDMMGEIAAFDTSTKGFMYGYLVSGEITKGISGKQRLKIFNENGKMLVLETADNVRLNGEVKKGTSLMTDSSAIYNNGIKSQLVRYITNEEGNLITEIFTATDFSGKDENGVQKFIDPERLNTFSMDDWVNENGKFVANTSYNTKFYGGSLKMYSNRYLVRSKTKIFVIPDEGAEDDEYGMLSPSSIQHTGEGGPDLADFGIYDTDEDSVTGAIVWMSGGDAVSGALPDIKDKAAVVESITKKLNEDGEVIEVINVITEDGHALSMTTQENQEIYFRCVLTDMTKDPKTPEGWRKAVTIPLKETVNGKEVYNLVPGDVITYQVTNSNEVQCLNYLFRSQYPKMVEQRVRTYDSVTGYGEYVNYWDMNTSYAKVRHVGQYGVGAMTYAYNLTPETATYPTYIFGTTLLYDSEKGTLTKISSSDIREGDMIFHKRRQYYTTLMVVYR